MQYFFLCYIAEHILVLTKQNKNKDSVGIVDIHFFSFNNNNHNKIYFSEATTPPHLIGVMVKLFALSTADRGFDI